ncbi:L-threonylcarbamoyladenylate synthase [Ferviditalea candida]|uniref:Threonylcarbamoyl-AMP synthase n=1 Tax=Ferviditalea candida TaxID=3108399 RepID=A0ABU5ZML3_9BACL|nr:L-threonylcarbamoyladenylate synthase [Paenibacillaceae bacterium T2]
MTEQGMETMQTKYWKASPNAEAFDPAILEAAEYLRSGRLVAFPTETVYGLGANALSTEAVEKIFQAKGRPSDNPLIVHIADPGQLDDLVLEYDAPVKQLIEAFWPGPLTLVLPVRPGAVSPRVTAGLSTIAVRMPDHPLALHLIRAAGCPVAAPSANRSGKPSPTAAEHVRNDLDGRIDGILDGGHSGVGLESTVVEWADGKVWILRPGGITPEDIRRLGLAVELDASLQSTGGDSSDAASSFDGVKEAGGPTPRSPGMKYRHYAPKGMLSIVQGDNPQKVSAYIQERIDEAKAKGEKTGILAFEEHLPYYRADVVLSCGSQDDLSSAGKLLYDALREFDREGVSYILAEGFREDGLGLAVMNRLHKAAGGRLIHI